MKNKIKEWFGFVLKILPLILATVVFIRYFVIVDQKVEVNTIAISQIETYNKEQDSKYYNIFKRLNDIENDRRNYITKTYFWGDNKIVKDDIMWTMDRLYILQGKVSMNTGKITGEHLNGSR